MKRTRRQQRRGQMGRRANPQRTRHRNCGQLSLLILFIFIPLGAHGQINAPPRDKIKFLLVADVMQVTLAGDAEKALAQIAGDYKSNDLYLQTTYYRSSKETESLNAACREISSGVSAIVDATESGFARLKAVADFNLVPYFRIEPTIGPFARAAADYVLNLNATDAALIFQNEADMQQATRALLANNRLRITAYESLRNETAYLLRENRPWPDMFLLFAETSSIRSILQSAVNNQLVTQDQQWLIVVLNLIGTDRSVTEWSFDLPVAVGELRPSGPEMCCPLIGDTAGCDCGIPPAVIYAFLMRVFDYLVDVMISGQGLITTIRKAECDNVPASFEAPTSSKNDDINNLYQQVLPRHPVLVYDTRLRRLSYKTAMDVTVVRARGAGRTSLAYWSPEKGLLVAQGRQVSAPRKLLRVGMIEAEPWSMKRNNKWEGYFFQLLTMLSNIMDFDFDIVQLSSLGDRQNTSTWTGGIGLLAKGDLDLICAPLTMTAERDEVIDFVIPYIEQTGLSIILKQPVMETSLFKFMTVLKTEVWIALAVSITITSFMMFALERFSPYSFTRAPHKYPYACRNFDLKECFWFTLTSFTPQGGGEPPKNLSARILVTAYWLFVVLMLATFTANLAAFLTVEKMQVPISSMEQLGRQSKIVYSVMKGGIAESYFSNMNDAERTLYKAWTMSVIDNEAEISAKYRVWNYPIKEQYSVIMSKIKDVPIATLREGIDRVVSGEGNFAFIHDAMILKYEVLRNCSLIEVGEMFGEQPYALGIPPGSPLAREFSKAVLLLQRDRYFDDLQTRVWNKSRRASCNLGENADSGITLESIGGVFIAMFAGLCMALLTLMVEVFYHRRKMMPSAVKPRFRQPGQLKKPGEPKKVPEKTPVSILKAPSQKSLTTAKKSVTLGDKETLESKTGLPKVSYITVYPKQ